MNRINLFHSAAIANGYVYHPDSGIYTKPIGTVLFTLSVMSPKKVTTLAAFKMCNRKLQPFVSYEIPLAPKEGNKDIIFTMRHISTQKKIEMCIAEAESYAAYMDDLWAPLFAPECIYASSMKRMPNEVVAFYAGRGTTIQQDADDIRAMLHDGKAYTIDFQHKFEALLKRVGIDASDTTVGIRVDIKRYEYAHPNEDEAYG